MVLAALVRFVCGLSALTNVVRLLIQVVFAPQAIPVWLVLACLVLVRPRRRRVLVPEVMRAESALRVFAAIMFAASSSQPDHVMGERFAMRPRERLPASFQLVVLNTLAVLAPVKMKFVLAACVPCLLAVKTC